MFFKSIYPGELKVKVKHSGTHATCLDLDIKIKHEIFANKLFNKTDKFPFFNVRLPHF